jgi:lipid II:glycine glycyltransferase (peptidoglycan interpeptide bridge formation enzyme)
VASDEAGQLVAGAQALVRGTPGGTLVYVPRGPVCAPGEPAWGELRAALRAVAGRSTVAVRYEPHWPDGESTRTWLADQGLRLAEPVQPPSTLRLDLAQDESGLLAAMKQKCRYNIGLAARRGVEVVEGDEGDLPAFGALMAETGARNRFAVRPAEYFVGAWRAFGPEHAHLYLARYEGSVLAAILVFHFADTATYLYGASGNRERGRMPNHLLQWEAIRRAKAAGLRWYDFWGIPDAIGLAARAGLSADDVPDGEGGLWGVWRFKRGFGGEVARSVGAWDDVAAPVRYWLGTRVLPRVRRALSVRP